MNAIHHKTIITQRMQCSLKPKENNNISVNVTSIRSVSLHNLLLNGLGWLSLWDNSQFIVIQSAQFWFSFQLPIDYGKAYNRNFI